MKSGIECVILAGSFYTFAVVRGRILFLIFDGHSVAVWARAAAARDLPNDFCVLAPEIPEKFSGPQVFLLARRWACRSWGLGKGHLLELAWRLRGYLDLLMGGSLNGG